MGLLTLRFQLKISTYIRLIMLTTLAISGLITRVACQSGILFPQDSETRERKSLDGIWNFRIAPRNDAEKGFREEWFKKPLTETGDVELMPVPSSYNDVTQSKLIRDHVGWAWYDREFRVPRNWFNNQRIWLRFGSVNYHAIVWINGIKLVEHSGGHLPFEGELNPSFLSALGTNRLTVAVNNTLSPDTVPQGRVVHQTAPRFPAGYFTLEYNFDFFNYAGIHRPVYLYTTPKSYINDISVTSEASGTTGKIFYSIQSSQSLEDDLYNRNNIVDPDEVVKQSFPTSVRLEDKRGNIVASATGSTGILNVQDAKLWWPFSMVANISDAGYLYTLVATLEDGQGQSVDVYRLKVGIRTLFWDTKTFLINEKPFYFRGFGRHEDFNIRGKGIDNVMLVKDHNLLKWIGGNSYRTSHYPYAEEIMDITDELGIVIIDEISAVSLDGFGALLLANHKQQMKELIQRDKNRASVVMWSVANEPSSQKVEAGPYFKEVVDLTRNLDTTRPVTIVVAQEYDRDQTAQYVDIICINRYFAWYSDVGHTEIITNSMILDMQGWVSRFNRPIIVAEYGADTIAGLHMSPEFVFTEEYQLEYLQQHFKAFDYLRSNSSLIGEMIWNFADFMTGQGITRIVGNRKGVFTRERQPKSAAHLLRTRYHLLAKELDDFPIPEDLQYQNAIYKHPNHKTEL